MQLIVYYTIVREKNNISAKILFIYVKMQVRLFDKYR